MQDNNWTRELKEAESRFSRHRPFIYEPPCKECALFKPSVMTGRDGEFVKITICLSNVMRDDFTCYVEKEDTDD